MSIDLNCPVDHVSINERKVRFTALWVLLIGAAFLLTGFWPLIAFLSIDFFLRAFSFGEYSPLHFLSEQVVRLTKLPAKPVDRAPKQFAAGVGLFFTLAILGTCVGGLSIVTLILTGILLFFAFLESALGFCAGCFVYSFLIRFFPAIVK